MGMQLSAKEGSTKKEANHDAVTIVIVYLVTRGVSFRNVSYADNTGFGGGGSLVDMVGVSVVVRLQQLV